MKIKIKLITCILIMLIVPIVVINSISAHSIRTNCVEMQCSSIERTVKNQADDINSIFEDVISGTKDFTVLDNVRRFTERTSVSGYDYTNRDALYDDVNTELSRLHNYNNSLLKAMIVNNSGIVVASTDEDEISRRLSNYKELFSVALLNNGFSALFMSSENGSNIPVFIVTKSIYSTQNERVGIVYTLYDTTYLQKYINSIKLDKYTSIAVMDYTGNIIEYPFQDIKTYSDNSSYSSYSEAIKVLISGGDTTGVLNTIKDISDSSGEKYYYSAAISNTNWYLISVSNKKNIENTINQYNNSTELISAVIAIIAIILTFVIAEFFTRPVMDIIKVFLEKQKGNNNTSFNIKTNDEFHQIGLAFNSMFDSMFESEQRYRTIVEMTNNITFEINFKKSTVFVSKNFNKKFSFRPKNDSLEESFFYKLRIHKDDKERYNGDLERILGPANFIQGEYRVKSIYGDFIWIMIKATKFFDRDEVPTKIIGVIVDIDREKKSEMHLLQRASYDNLTQLLNRETFLKTLAGEIEVSLMKKTLAALMFIDLDDFKYFNDQYGHACGDEVLKFVADTLKEISFECGFAGRFGGDEFVVCFNNLTLYGDSGKLAQEIIDILGKGFISDSTGKKLYIKCSIGIAFLRESGKTTSEVIAAADEAMYNIKKHGKSAYAYAKSNSSSNDNSPSPEDVAPSTSGIDSDRT